MFLRTLSSWESEYSAMKKSLSYQLVLANAHYLFAGWDEKLYYYGTKSYIFEGWLCLSERIFYTEKKNKKQKKTTFLLNTGLCHFQKDSA